MNRKEILDMKDVRNFVGYLSGDKAMELVDRLNEIGEERIGCASAVLHQTSGSTEIEWHGVTIYSTDGDVNTDIAKDSVELLIHAAQAAVEAHARELLQLTEQP